MLLLFWIILGAILFLVEVITTSFFIVFFGFAAFSVALLTFFFSLALSTQAIYFVAFSVLYLFVLRRLIKKKKKKTWFAPNAPIGEYGVAFDDILPNSYGRVVIRDTIWKAQSKGYVKKGSTIRVISQNNLTLEVQCHY